MATCKKIKRVETKVCIGSMNTLIQLKLRSITTPQGNSVDFGESFSTLVSVWAMVDTISGEKLFDGSNIERLITHDFYIRFIADVTFENWVCVPQKYGDAKSYYFDIIKIENINMQNEFYRIRCSIRGDATKQVNWS
jgi:head-tail adaptor